MRPDGTIKLADLGLSVFLSESESSRKTACGSLFWISPEISQGILYSKEVDIWSYGCFAYELLTGRPPFWQDFREAQL